MRCARPKASGRSMANELTLQNSSTTRSTPSKGSWRLSRRLSPSTLAAVWPLLGSWREAMVPPVVTRTILLMRGFASVLADWSDFTAGSAPTTGCRASFPLSLVRMFWRRADLFAIPVQDL